MNSMKALAGLGCLLVGTALSTSSITSFPGRACCAVAPNGRLSVVNEDQDREPNHILWLRHQKSGDVSMIMAYKRHVEVSWSRDSRFFFVNDYAESNESDCVIVDVKNMKKRSMIAVINSKLRQWGAARAGHLYVTCTSWKRRNHLDVRVSAYGFDGHSLDRRMVVQPWSGQILITR